jgi:D-inositol-3-phosphate glycosyltransferase
MVGVSRDHIMRYTNDRSKVAIIPNGVDLEVFKPRSRSLSRARLDLAADRQIALFVAALDSAHRSKNLGGLLESFAGAKLAKGLLLVVGDGDLKRSYQLLARQLGIGRQVVFLGAMSPSELPDVYSAADVTVVPSIDQESFGLTVVESWACGTPVIASSLPGMGSLVSEGVDGCLVQPGDVDALSAALKQAFVDQTTLERWGESGLEKVHKRFNWDGIAQTLEDLYQDAVLTPDAAARRRAN